MYIILEGIDTCGKSTQIDTLKRKFPQIIFTKEPGGTDFGKRAREILLNGEIKSKRAEILLFLADRAEHYDEIVKPNRKDKIVISDRGFISGIGYALANNDADFDTLIKLNLFALNGEFPDAVILFETDKETLKKRLSTKDRDFIESRGIDYLLKVQNSMKFALEKLAIPYLLIDAKDDIESINQKIINYLKL